MQEMSDQEKSVLLAKAMGDVFDSDTYCPICGWTYRNDGTGCAPGSCSMRPAPKQRADETPNLYDPANMALAWRVLNWASEQMPKETSPPGMVVHTWAGRLHSFWGESHWVGKSKLFIHSMPPADAQRLWLDKVLTLAIEAGLVEVEHAETG